MTQRAIARGQEYQVDIGINSNPMRCGGRPCIIGTRRSPNQYRGWTRTTFIENRRMGYCDLTDEQIEWVLRYWRVRGKGVQS